MLGSFGSIVLFAFAPEAFEPPLAHRVHPDTLAGRPKVAGLFSEVVHPLVLPTCDMRWPIEQCEWFLVR